MSVRETVESPRAAHSVAPGAFEMVVGLEVHVQLLTRTKAFCRCATDFGAAPNTNVCPVCLGLPGALPVLNRKAVDLAIKAALAVGCAVASGDCRSGRGGSLGVAQISRHVIPGCALLGAGPESITPIRGYGFRVRASRAPE